MTGPAAQAVATLTDRGLTVAVAESLTGGLLGAALTDVPGASAVFRGGVTAYATAVKAELLGVPAELLDRVGPVDPQVAVAMAEGARRLLAVDWAIATTGVAGPGTHDGAVAGTVFVGCAGPCRTVVRELALAGDRGAIRSAAVLGALELLLSELGRP